MTTPETERAIGLVAGMVASARGTAGELGSLTVRRGGIAYTLDRPRSRAALRPREDTWEPPLAGAGVRRTPCAPPNGTGSAALRLAFEDT
jgi:hypothetical protein